MKYALITGAYGGMGRAAVNALKSAGYYVFALDKRVEEATDGVLPIAYDATNSESVSAAFEQVKSHTDRLDLVVHFAGIYTLNSLVEYTEEAFKTAFDINVFGVYRVNKAAMPFLKKGSKILVTTSELAPLDPLPFTGLYAVTKSTLDKYAYSLRMELQLLGVSVVVLRPGAVDTGLLDVSTRALDAFCENTALYSCNAARFKRVVESVEARKVSPEKVGRKVAKIASKRNPKYVYKLNRNPLLLLLNCQPKRLQTWIIKQILK